MIKLFYAVRWKKPIIKYRCTNVVADSYYSSKARGKVTSESEKWPGKYREPINKLIPYIIADKELSDICKANYIDSKTWSSYALSCRRKLVTEPLKVLDSQESLNYLCKMFDTLDEIKKRQNNSRQEDGDTKAPSVTDTDESEKHYDSLSRYLFDHMFKRALVDLKPIIEASKAFLGSNSVRYPPQWYPHARMQKRKIIYHGGPTNSGKVSCLSLTVIFTYLLSKLYALFVLLDSPSIRTIADGRPCKGRWLVLRPSASPRRRDIRAPQQTGRVHRLVDRPREDHRAVRDAPVLHRGDGQHVQGV